MDVISHDDRTYDYKYKNFHRLIKLIKPIFIKTIADLKKSSEVIIKVS